MICKNNSPNLIFTTILINPINAQSPQNGFMINNVTQDELYDLVLKMMKAVQVCLKP